VTKERLLVCWFLCTGLIHFVVEGAVVVDSRFYQDTSRNILSEICGWPRGGREGVQGQGRPRSHDAGARGGGAGAPGRERGPAAHRSRPHL
jgi:hypothetical protein